MIIEFFVVCPNVVNVTFLPKLYIWTDASILSYIKMLSYAKDFTLTFVGNN